MAEIVKADGSRANAKICPFSFQAVPIQVGGGVSVSIQAGECVRSSCELWQEAGGCSLRLGAAALMAQTAEMEHREATLSKIEDTLESYIVSIAPPLPEGPSKN